MAEAFPRRGLLRMASAAGLLAAGGLGFDEAPKTSEAKPEDVGSIEGIVAAVYDVISGPKKQARDWGRMRGLFVPDARLLTCHADAGGKVVLRKLSVDDYITMFGPALEEHGFVEKEVARRVDRFGHTAQVFSTYETRLDGSDKVVGRGINGIQLFWDEARWWVATIYWDGVTPSPPIPAEYEAKPRPKG